MGIHEECIKCAGDCGDGVDRGEMCRDCLKAEITKLKAVNKALIAALKMVDGVVGPALKHLGKPIIAVSFQPEQEPKTCGDWKDLVEEQCANIDSQAFYSHFRSPKKEACTKFVPKTSGDGVKE